MKKTIILVIFLLVPLFPCLAQDAPAVSVSQEDTNSEVSKPQNFYEQPAERFSALRNQVFSDSAQIAGIKVASASEPWCVLMEVGVPEGIGTLVAFKDGTASLYFSTGKVIIGGGQHKDVSVAAKNLVTISKDYVSGMNKTQDYPLPDVGKVRFYMLTSPGIFTGEQLDEKELADGAHPLSGLFYLGREVVTALQKIDEK
jgi:hypothetical protein